MKKCDYCGRDNADDTAQCHECGTPFAMSASQTSKPEIPESPARTEAERQMVKGAIIFFIGIAVTLLTYLNALNSPMGGTYVVAWGAILFGAVRSINGYRAKNASHLPPDNNDIGYDELAIGARLESEGRAEEAIAAYTKVIEEFPDTDASRDAQKSIESLQAKIG